MVTTRPELKVDRHLSLELPVSLGAGHSVSLAQP